MNTTIINQLRRFHTDEEGLEALQVVIIVAIAAIVMALISKTVFPKTKDWMSTQLKTLGITL